MLRNSETTQMHYDGSIVLIVNMIMEASFVMDTQNAVERIQPLLTKKRGIP